jgi:hypothetical protein
MSVILSFSNFRVFFLSIFQCGKLGYWVDIVQKSGKMNDRILLFFFLSFFTGHAGPTIRSHPPPVNQSRWMSLGRDIRLVLEDGRLGLESLALGHLVSQCLRARMETTLQMIMAVAVSTRLAVAASFLNRETKKKIRFK